MVHNTEFEYVCGTKMCAECESPSVKGVSICRRVNDRNDKERMIWKSYANWGKIIGLTMSNVKYKL